MSHTSTLDYRELPSFKQLFLDYLYRFEKLSPFFTADPHERGSWERLASSLEGTGGERASVASPLRALNGKLGADERALSTIDRLDDGALVVITGQQVGLMGGPLYTLYKALTAVRLARSAEELLQRSVVPLFWMASDDHDFEEVQQTSILDRDHGVHDLRYEAADPDRRLPMGKRELSANIEEVMAAASETLPETEFKEDVLAALGESYAPGRTMAEAFGRWLLRLTAGTGLALVDPTLAELKSIGAPLFEREVVESSEGSRIVQKTTDELIELGYHAQASPMESQLNLFCADPERYPPRTVGLGHPADR